MTMKLMKRTKKRLGLMVVLCVYFLFMYIVLHKLNFVLVLSEEVD